MNVADAHHMPDADDPVLADLAERITCRLQSGDSVEADHYIGQYPARAGVIRGLVALLDDLTALGRSMAHRRARNPDRIAADDESGTPKASRRPPLTRTL